MNFFTTPEMKLFERMVFSNHDSTKTLPTNINDYPTKSEIVVNVAGYIGEDITVEVSEDRDELIIIAGKIVKQMDGDPNPKRYMKKMHTEFDYDSSFPKERRIQITNPESYDLEKITSECSYGILKIYLPYKPTKKKENIKIKIGS